MVDIPKFIREEARRAEAYAQLVKDADRLGAMDQAEREANQRLDSLRQDAAQAEQRLAEIRAAEAQANDNLQKAQQQAEAVACAAEDRVREAEQRVANLRQEEAAIATHLVDAKATIAKAQAVKSALQ